MEEVKPIFDTDNQMLSVTFLSRELFFQALQEYMQTMKPYLRSRAGGSEHTRAPNPTFPDRKCVFQPLLIFTSTRWAQFQPRSPETKSIFSDFAFVGDKEAP